MRAPEVVVIGGATMDLHARAADPVVPGTSNPGSASVSPGGVGRNVAENLARLGTPTSLVSVLGDDPLGADVLEQTAAAGVDVTCVRRRGRTGTYTAILDDRGELVVGVCDLEATAEISPLILEASREQIAGARLLVVDGNISVPALDRAFELAAAAGVRIVLDPVSVPKARRLAGLLAADRPVFLLSPNRAELAALTDLPTDTDAELESAAAALRARGAELVWVRLGSAGSLLSSAEGCSRLAALPTDVRSVTGAGDAMLAAFCHAMLAGSDPLEAARYGHAAAALTCATARTVSPELSDDVVRSLLP